MSTEQIDKYKELYSKYIELSVDLYNVHHQFVKTSGYRVAREFRQIMKEIQAVQRELVKSSRLAYKEGLENFKTRKKLIKEQSKAERRKYYGRNNKKRKTI